MFWIFVSSQTFFFWESASGEQDCQRFQPGQLVQPNGLIPGELQQEQQEALVPQVVFQDQLAREHKNCNYIFYKADNLSKLEVFSMANR